MACAKDAGLLERDYPRMHPRDVDTLSVPSTSTSPRLEDAEKTHCKPIRTNAPACNLSALSEQAPDLDIEKRAAEPPTSTPSVHRTPTHRSRVSKPLNTLVQTLTTRSNASLVDPGPPPDGGIKAWTQACMGHLVILNTWGMVATFGVFQAYYTQELGLEPSAVSWIGSVQMLGHFGLGAFPHLRSPTDREVVDEGGLMKCLQACSPDGF